MGHATHPAQYANPCDLTPSCAQRSNRTQLLLIAATGKAEFGREPRHGVDARLVFLHTDHFFHGTQGVRTGTSEAFLVSSG